MKKYLTYARTIWHEFWMYMLVGPSKVSYHRFPDQKVPTYLKPPVKPKLEVNAAVSRPEWCHKMEEGFSPNPKLALVFQETPKPTKRLWVYNVSRIDHEVDHPQLGRVKIPANTTAKRYALWTSFPDVVIGTSSNLYVNELATVPESGQKLVEGIINPDGIYSNSCFKTSIGRDLSVKGVFWSYNNPPTIKEVNAAVRPMKARYADLLEKATILFESAIIRAEHVKAYMAKYDCSLEKAISVVRTYSLGEITPEMHAAAEYFKVTTPWHPVLRD